LSHTSGLMLKLLQTHTVTFVLDTALPFISRSQVPVKNIAFSFIMTSTSRVKGLSMKIHLKSVMLQRVKIVMMKLMTMLLLIQFVKKIMMQIQ
jgi:hypothetical protein